MTRVCIDITDQGKGCDCHVYWTEDATSKQWERADAKVIGQAVNDLLEHLEEMRRAGK